MAFMMHLQVVCIFAESNFLFRTADAFCMAENMILQATELR